MGGIADGRTVTDALCGERKDAGQLSGRRKLRSAATFSTAASATRRRGSRISEFALLAAAK